MRSYKPVSKMTKKEKREYYAKQRNSWGNVKPITRVKRSKKLYDRKRDKRALEGGVIRNEDKLEIKTSTIKIRRTTMLNKIHPSIAKRPIVTSFMLVSADGKISTGGGDERDFDQDLPQHPYIASGIEEYYNIEETTDLWSMMSGKIWAKLGVNDTYDFESKPQVTFVIVDNSHLTYEGIKNIAEHCNKVVLITGNLLHPAYKMSSDKVKIIYQENYFKPKEALERLYELGCKRLTLQSGSTLNMEFFKAQCIDYIDWIVAPIIIGGESTPSVVGGQTFDGFNVEKNIRYLKLIEVSKFCNSFLRLRYEVMKHFW